jgi:hypothetical protein
MISTSVYGLPSAISLKTKIAAETTSSPDESPLFSGVVEQLIV